jgi:very-short-patch-repair endonuclease
VVTRRQLLHLRLGRAAIDYRLAIGQLHGIHRGVMAVGHSRLNQHGQWMAAVLSCGEAALLSHRSAGVLWGVAPYAGPRIDVTAPCSRRRNRDRIVVYGCRVHASDRGEREGIPVTSVARTLFDLAEIVDSRRLERAFETAERLRLLDLAAVEQVIHRNPGRRALRPLLTLLPSLVPPPETRSHLERRFLDFCHDANLRTPTVNATVAGFEVDAFWPSHQLIVELDGYELHRTRAAFERDRVRDSVLQAAGYRILRLTSRRLTTEPAAIASLIRRLLTPPL